MCVLPSVCMCACHRQLARPCAQVKSRLISTSEREVIQPPLWIITGRCEDVSPLCPLYVSNENKLILFPKSSQLSLTFLGRITGCIMVEHDWTSCAVPAGGRHTWSQVGPQERFSILPCGQNTRAALLDSHCIPKVFVHSHQTPHLLPSSAPCKLALVFSAKHICCARWLSRHNYTSILQH